MRRFSGIDVGIMVGATIGGVLLALLLTGHFILAGIFALTLIGMMALFMRLMFYGDWCGPTDTKMVSEVRRNSEADAEQEHGEDDE